MASSYPSLTFVIPHRWYVGFIRVKVSSKHIDLHAGNRTHEAMVAGTHQLLVVTSRAGRAGRAGRVFITRSATSDAPAAEVPAAEVPPTQVSSTQVSGPKISAVAAAEVPTAAVAVVLPPQSSKALLLGVCVYICPDYEANNVEERHPGVFRQELLGEGQGDGRNDPADLHDRHETSLDGGAHLVEGTGACNDSHGHEVYRVLDGGDLQRSVVSAMAGHGGRATRRLSMAWTAYNQVADENLQDLGLEALATAEDLLEDADKDVAERGADEGAVQGHLGDARGEVVAVLAPVMGNPRGEELLQAGQGARGEHLGAQRVLLQLLQVGLQVGWSAGMQGANCASLTAR